MWLRVSMVHMSRCHAFVRLLLAVAWNVLIAGNLACTNVPKTGNHQHSLAQPKWTSLNGRNGLSPEQSPPIISCSIADWLSSIAQTSFYDGGLVFFSCPGNAHFANNLKQISGGFSSFHPTPSAASLAMQLFLRLVLATWLFSTLTHGIRWSSENNSEESVNPVEGVKNVCDVSQLNELLRRDAPSRPGLIRRQSGGDGDSVSVNLFDHLCILTR